MHPSFALPKKAYLSRLTILGVALACATLAPAQNALILSPVAEVGDTAPGTGNPWTALSTQFAAVGIDGGVAFTGTANSLDGLWFGDPGSIALAAQEGQAAPGGGGALYDNFTNSVTALDVFGAGFAARLDNARDGIWSVAAGPVLSLVALEGEAAPGAGAGVTYTILNRAYFNNDGDLTYYATLSSGGSRSLWRKLVADVNPVIIARSGTATNLAAPAVLIGSTYQLVGDELSINDNATVVFHSRLNDPDVTAADDEALFTLPSPTPAAPTLLAREGDVPPGTAFPLGSFTSCHINDDGDVLFRANLGGAAPVEENSGVWLHDGALNAVAIEGDVANGAANIFFDTFEELFLANNGVIGLVAIVRDTAGAGGNIVGRGVWVDAGAGLELVALVGQNALGKDGVSVYGQITAINQVSMNMDGDLAVEMVAAGERGVWVREAVAASATRQLIVGGDKTYDSDRQVGIANTVDLPEKEDFTAFGGGPFGRPRAMGEDGVPLLDIDTTVGDGLYFPRSQTLNAFITSTREQAPGTPVGTLFDSLRPAGTLSESGLLALRGYLEDGTGDAAQGISIQGIWAEVLSGGVPQLTLVARQGSATPGGDTFGQLPNNPIYNSNGSIAFAATLEGGGSILCAGQPGALTEIAKTGDAVGLTGANAGEVYAIVRSLIAYNNSGRLAASCTFALDEVAGVTSSNDSAIVRYGAGARVVAREGGSTGTTGVFDNLLNRPVLINNSNRIAFIANRKRNPALSITSQNAAGVWYSSGTTLTPVAVGSETAPGTGGALFLKPTDHVFNDSDRIIFRTTLQGGGVTVDVNDVAYYSSVAGVSPSLWIRTGSTQDSGNGPGGVAGAATFAVLDRPDCDDDTKIVFRARLTVGTAGVTADDDEGIWTSTGAGATTLLLREGGFAPDANGNATAAVFDAFDQPAISLDGRVVVSATLQQGVGGIGAANDRALFVQGSDGNFYRVVQKGQSLDVADGLGGSDPEVIEDVSFPAASGGAGGFYKAINSDGFVLAYLTFEDGETASMVFLVP